MGFFKKDPVPPKRDDEKWRDALCDTCMVWYDSNDPKEFKAHDHRK